MNDISKIIENIDAGIKQGFEKADRMRFEELVEPLMDFLNETGHPHMKIIIDSTCAEIVEGCAMYRTEAFLRD